MVLRAPCRRNITRILYCFLQNPDPVCLPPPDSLPGRLGSNILALPLRPYPGLVFTKLIYFSGNPGEMDLWEPGPVLLDAGKYPFGLSSPSRRRCPALENEGDLTVQLVAQVARLFKSFLLGLVWAHSDFPREARGHTGSSKGREET